MASIRNDDGLVTIKKHPLRWRKLPLRVKKDIIASIDRVRELRGDIASSARVSIMPPVQVLDVCWTTPGRSGCLHGRTTLISVRGRNEVGVQLTAPAILYADDQALRGILLHEFSHCFYYARFAARAAAGPAESDLPGTENPLADDEYDRKVLENPEDWFSTADAELFPYSHSTLLGPCTDLIAERWISAGLPTEIPSSSSIAGNFRVPEEIIEHARRLDGSRGDLTSR